MQLFDALNTRRSIRRFTAEPISTETIEEIIAAARMAPFGTAREQRHFVVLTGEAKTGFIDFLHERMDALLPALEEGCSSKRILSYAHDTLPTIGAAPVIVLVYTEFADSGPLLSICSAAAAAENLLLAAHDRGLAACWTTGAIYLADEISAYLGTDDLVLLALIPIGHPDQAPRPRPRDRDLVHWHGFADRPAAARREPLVPEPSAEPTGAPRLLVIDDSAPSLAHYSQILAAAGYDVCPLSDPTRAVEVFNQCQPQMVLLDTIMPGANGLQVVKQLREVASGMLPIIMGTTTYTPADEEMCLAAGADDVVAKPIPAHVLLARVRAHLRARSLYEELDRANAALRDLQKLRDDLTGMIVHDLRGPLTSVLGSLQMLEQSDYPDELVREFVPLSIESGGTLLAMVNDLLDVSKMEAGAIELDRTQFDLSEVAAAVVALLQPLTEDHAIYLRAEMPDAPLLIEADRGFVRRIITNLVTNALKFTYEGGVTVRVSMTDHGESATVAVIDTGEGVPPEFRERIFEKFGQAESRRQGKKLGTGLGLTFVKMAAEAHGGRIELQSKVGVGSTFTVTLPLGHE
jgi:two-component system, sensor histidine kinase and response regulator